MQTVTHTTQSSSGEYDLYMQGSEDNNDARTTSGASIPNGLDWSINGISLPTAHTNIGLSSSTDCPVVQSAGNAFEMGDTPAQTPLQIVA